MKALVLSGDRRSNKDPTRTPASTVWANPRLTLEDVPEPMVQTPHDVVVRVVCCGVCGSDLHCSASGPDSFVTFGGPANLPTVLGHELAGTVAAKGSAVSHLSVGEAVTAESIVACWRCAECLAGHLNECRQANLLGLTVNGAFTEFVRVDARHCYSIERLVRQHGPAQAFAIGALFEPMGVALRGLKRAGFTPADRLAVVGLGPIGLGVIILARLAGVTQVVGFDINESRVQIARSFGATCFSLSPSADGDIAAVTRTVCGEQGASLVVEAAGTKSGFEAAFAALANRSRLLVLGRMPGRVPLDTNQLLTTSTSVIGSRGHAGYGIFPELIERAATGEFDPTVLISSRFPFSDWTEAFAVARTQSGTKTLITMET